jgi:hypothetical protein
MDFFMTIDYDEKRTGKYRNEEEYRIDPNFDRIVFDEIAMYQMSWVWMVTDPISSCIVVPE